MKALRSTSVARHAWLVAVGLLAAYTGTAAADEPDPLVGPYFGQPPPGLEAEIFSPDVISKMGRYEFALNFAPGGQRLLFTVQTASGVVQVMHSRVSDGIWTEPEPVSLAAGARKDEMEAFFSPDGRHVYFAPYDEGLDVRIWQVEIAGDRWVDPIPLPGPIAEAPAFFPTSATSGAIYYTNITERRPFRAHRSKTGEWHVAPLDIEFGGHTFVAPDESFVLVDSLGWNGDGKSDLYVAFATEAGDWTRPIHLGDEVNSQHSETCPSLSEDGKYLFFSRYDEPDEVAQIYWIDSGVIEIARQQLLSE